MTGVILQYWGKLQRIEENNTEQKETTQKGVNYTGQGEFIQEETPYI